MRHKPSPKIILEYKVDVIQQAAPAGPTSRSAITFDSQMQQPLESKSFVAMHSTSSFDAGVGGQEAMSAFGQGQAQQLEAAQLAGQNYGSDSSPPQAKGYRSQVQKGSKLYHHDMHIPNKFLQVN